MDKSGSIRHFANFCSMFYCFHYLFYWESLRYLAESTTHNFIGWMGLNLIFGFSLAFFIEWLQGKVAKAKLSWSDIKAGVFGIIIGMALLEFLPDNKIVFWISLPVFIYTTYLGVKPILMHFKK